MARIHGTDTRIYVNQWNLSGRANTLDLDAMMRPSREVTAFEDAAETYVAGKTDRRFGAAFRAASDFDSGEIDDIIQQLITATTPPLWGFYFDGSAAGSHGYEGQGLLDRKSVRSPRDNASMLEAQVQGTGPYMLGRAMKLNEATVITGTGNQTGQNHQVAGVSDRLLFIARIIAVSGAGSITLKLQESSDGGGDPYADAITLTAMTALGAQLGALVPAGTLGPFYRVNVSAFSGFTNVTLRAAVAVIPGG